MSFTPVLVAAPFLFVAAHLARIAYASRALPDRLLSACFLGLGLGAPLRLMALEITTRAGTSSAADRLNSGGDLFIGSAIVCLVAFSWQVFRRDAAWAKALVVAFAVALAGLTAAGMSEFGRAQSGSVATAFNGLAAFGLLWAFVECLLYYRQMRRRQALGMADPVVANRFLLWSLWTGALGLQGSLQMLLRVALLIDGAGAVIHAGGDPGGPWLDLILALKLNLAVVAPTVVVSVWLSFSPPAAYRRWLEAQPEPDAR